MQRIGDVPVFGDPVEPEALQQIQRCRSTARAAVLMADHHVGYSVPIGGVVVYKDALSPSGVGFDIGCGNKAVLTDMPGSEARARIKPLMDDIWARLSFGMGQKNKRKVESSVFELDDWRLPAAAKLKSMAHEQLGTIGSGNHYVDIFIDELDRVWVGVHFGSRGLGHKLATHFLREGGARDEMHGMPLVFQRKQALFDDYVVAMRLAGAYAYAGRDWVCAEVVRMMGARVREEVHNHHNFAWLEQHHGEMLWVVRKGATPAFPGQKGFVGGSMGDDAVILEGVEGSLSRTAYYSTVHGAGRVMSRTKARGKVDRRTGEVIAPGLVSRQMMTEWVRERGVELRGAGTDESPHCYKRLPEVLAHHAETVRVLHTLRPIGVAMAGEKEFDPYKD
ncbi:MAG: RtcB family protein [Candidatus Eisenbacteria bacterium]|nr:RtcB family protein [Candidatus Eisenbacteria bacterium]